MILRREEYLPCYGVGVGGNGVSEGVDAPGDGVNVLVGAEVKEGVGVYDAVGTNVDVNVNVGVRLGVIDGVNVDEGVKDAGWKGVGEGVMVAVFVGVKVKVGVLVTVPVTMGGVKLTVGIPSVLVTNGAVVAVDTVGAVGVGVIEFEEGASNNASHPTQ